MDGPSLLANMVGKLVVVEWVGVDPPEPAEGEDTVEELSFGVFYLSERIGKRGGVLLQGYDQFGIVVQSDMDDAPFFIAWNAVLQIQPLEPPE
ncbi:MAG TPA: hypothetical protein VE288_12180 [Rubrobacteraceae bacterium]|nr:hypothetical protein [Rubrobacteraceae bacterium]